MSHLAAEHERKRLEEHTRKLKEKLRELFQIGDIAQDLDFGMYRIMHQKRGEVEEFIDTTLGRTVDEAFGTYTGDARAGIAAERETLERTIREEIDEGALGPGGILPQFLNSKRNRDLNDRWKQLRSDESRAAMSDQHKAEIFAHIAEFFTRYYKDGDFLSLPRYSKREKYAIPYNGEEVVLHWANKDQYYVKTDLWLNNYVFDAGVYKVVFEVCRADNPVNTANDKELVFVLSRGDDAVEFDQDEKVLTIRFARAKWNDEEMGEFLPEGANLEKPTKEHLREAIVREVITKVNDDGLKAALNKRAYPDRTDNLTTILQQHVTRFTTENTYDFFIHKDLHGFLTRELEFYLKNEVINLDDLGTDGEVSPDDMKQYMTRARIIKQISSRIIDFLAQMEDFQKVLWEKKKFVLATDYCITLDYVPEEYYDEILANQKQIAEWKSLYGAGEEEQISVGVTTRGITSEYLRSHPYLVIDTKFFDETFKEKLLGNLRQPDGTPVQNLDMEAGGLMIHSENWQALNLLQETYLEQLKCSYIDPPYNTGSDEFLYKDSYQHSSWLTMLYERMILAKKLLSRSAIFSCSIDDNEMYRLGLLFEELFGEKQRAACAPWLSEPSGGKEKTGLRTGHEYLLIYHNGEISEFSQDEISVGDLDRRDKWGAYRKGRELRKWGGTSLKKDRPNQHYPLTAPDGTQVLPIRNDGQEGHWRWGKDNPKIIKALADPEYFHWEKTPFDNGATYNGMRERWTPFEKIRNEKKAVGWSTWLDTVGINADATRTLKELFGEKNFSTPKPVQLLKWFLNLHDDDNGIAIDFFAGSGVVAHAVLDLNFEDESKRKYILVEMGDYFHSVMIPRIEKVVYAAEWKNGKPVQGSIGQSHIFKYQTLEQYEDTLDNIVFREQDGTIARTLTGFSDYMLKYMLGFETQGSACRLNTDLLKKPFDYTLRIRRRKLDVDHLKCSSHEEGSNTWWDVKVDLIETFSYLIGLHVQRIAAYDENDLHYRVVHGRTRDNGTVTIVWRNSPEGEAALNADEKFINETVKHEFPASTLYINGQFFVKEAEHIEPKFRELMGA